MSGIEHSDHQPTQNVETVKETKGGEVRTTLGMLPLLAVSAALSGPMPAYAQEDGSAIELDRITVEGAGKPDSTFQRDLGLRRVPTTVQDTPQVIDVISEEQIRQRQAVGLRDIVRSVPGVTLNAGEGGGGSQPGDNFNIRGFSANGNIFTDGLRNLGIYNRDAFNLEAVEVFKGSSGPTFGRGAGGGAINMRTKAPQAEQFVHVDGTIGTDSYYRSTVDMNVPVTPDVAVRLNAMGLSRDFAERDHANAERWAVAPSVTFGMRGDTSLTLDYLHQYENNVVDNGVPFAYGNELFEGGTAPLPVTEYGVPRSNFYGYTDNFERIDADILTARFEHSFNPSLTLYNDARVGRVKHDRSYVALTSGAASWAPVGCVGVAIEDCFLDIDTGGRNGSTLHYARAMESRMAENQTTLAADVQTGPLTHELRATVGLLWEDHEQQNYEYVGSAPNLNLLNPVFGPSNQQRNETTRLDTRVNSQSVGLYDRVGLGHGFYAIGNVRYERYSMNATTRDLAGAITNSGRQTENLWTYQAALQYKPTDNQTYYVSYSRSELPLYDPNLEYSHTPDPESEPERAETYEAGLRYGILENRLGLGASVFRTERSNMRVADETAPGVSVLGGKRVVRGLELQADGRLTDQVSVNVGYAYLDSEVKDFTDANNGNQMMRVPRHSAFAWLTYQPFEDVSLGGGTTFVGKRYTSDSNDRYMPAHWQFDAMASYQITENFGVQLNGINLTNERTYDGTHTVRHVLPGVGRTFLLTGSASF